jgi:hypothetical protein
VQEAVLLGQPVAEGERDIDFTGRYVTSSAPSVAMYA